MKRTTNVDCDPTGCDPTCQGLSEPLQEKLADILDRYLQASEQGLPADIDELVADCPELRTAVCDYLEGLQLLEGGAAAFRQHAGTPAKPASVPLVTRELGDFQLVQEIGRGGMGIVYEARQMSLDRKVALKVLPFASMLDSKQIQRFQNEARSAAQLHHPNIVPIFFVGIERGVHFYACSRRWRPRSCGCCSISIERGA